MGLTTRLLSMKMRRAIVAGICTVAFMPFAQAFVLENDLVRLEFRDDRGFGVTGIVNKVAGNVRFGCDHAGDDFWRLELARPNEFTKPAHGRGGEYVTIPVGNRQKAQDCRIETKGGLNVVFCWDGLDVVDPQTGKTLESSVIDVRANVELDPDGGESRWTLDVVNRSTRYALVETVYPIVRRLGRPGACDVLEPRSNLGAWLVHNRKTADPKADWTDGKYMGYQPMVTAVMQDGAGVYFAAHDGSGRIKRIDIDAENTPSFHTVVENAGVIGKAVGTPGYPVVIDVFKGNWWQAAKKYRRWALRQVWAKKGPILHRKDYPKAMCETPLWINVHGCSPEMASNILTRAHELYPDFPAGLHWHGWNKWGHDSHYPEMFPTVPGVKEVMPYLKGIGQVPMIYTNGRLWDAEIESWTNAQKSASLRPNGARWTETYANGRVQGVMCPYVSSWQDTLVALADRVTGELRAPSLFMDQIGAAGPQYCHDPSHGHPLGGGTYWFDGYRAMLTRIHDMTAARGAMLTTEGTGETWIDLVDGYLTVTRSRGEDVPFYPAVYSGYTTYFGTPQSHLDSPDSFWAMQARQVLWGVVPGWYGYWNFTDTKNPVYGEIRSMVGRLCAFRQKHLGCLAYGELLDDVRFDDEVGEVAVTLNPYWLPKAPTLKFTLPAVMGSVWRDGRNGQIVRLLANLSNVSQTVRVKGRTVVLAPRGFAALPEREREEADRSDRGHAASVTWRLSPSQWTDETAFKELVTHFVQSNVTGKISLFVAGDALVHAPMSLERLRRQVDLGRIRLRRLHDLGFEAGFNLLCSVGQTAEAASTSPVVPGARHCTNSKGQVSPSCYCANDSVWRERYVRPALEALAAAKPDFIWFDDDLRLHGRGVDGANCFCDGCMARRSSRLGCPTNRAELARWLDDPQEGRSRKRALMQDNRDALADFFAFADAVVREADDTIALGVMEADSPFDGQPFAEKHVALGDGRKMTYWRPGCGAWNDVTPDAFLVKANHIAATSVLVPRRRVKLESEIENFPYHPFGKSVHFTALETLLYAAVGTDGVAYNVLASPNEDRFAVNLPMIAALNALRPLMDRYVTAAAGATPRGVWNGAGRDLMLGYDMRDGTWLDRAPWMADGGFLGKDAQKVGFPVSYRAEDAVVCAPDAPALLSMTDVELDRMFAGGVYLDAEAFRAALARGRAHDVGFAAAGEFGDLVLEELTDDALNGTAAGLRRNARPSFFGGKAQSFKPSPKARVLARLVDGFGQEVASCVQGVYENARGGRVCVNGYSPWKKLGNMHSVEQMRRVMRWLSHDRLPGCVTSAHRVSLWVRGDGMAVLYNPSADVLQGVSVELTDAVWRKGARLIGGGAFPGRMQAADLPLVGEETKGGTRFALPEMGPWSVAVLTPAGTMSAPQPIRVGMASANDTVYRADCDTYDVRLADTVCVDDPRLAQFSHTNALQVAFHLKKLKNVTLDFRGATVRLHGRIQPFLLDECENVRIVGVNVLYDRSPFTQGEIVRVGDGRLELKIDRKRFPYAVENGDLVFTSETWKTRGLDVRPQFIQFFDGKTRRGVGSRLTLVGRAPKLDPKFPWAGSTILFTVRDEGDRLVLTSDNLRGLEKTIGPGALAVFGHEDRDLSNCRMLCCRNVTLKDYRILNGFGMGVFPIRCENVTLEGLKMTCDERSPGVVANCADGVHAIACSGDFILRDSVIEGTIDDALNVHGNFLKLKAANGTCLTADTCLELGGATPVVRPGDRLRVYRGLTTAPAAEYVVQAVRPMDRKAVAFDVDRPVSAHAPGDAIENMSAQCRLSIRNCRFGKANTHLRIQTRGPVVMENCRTEMPIWLTGDLNYWYESSPCESFTARNVDFVGMSGTVRAIPEVAVTPENPFYHGCLTLERCRFDNGRPVFARKTRRIVVEDCRQAQGGRLTIDLEDCGESSASECEVVRKSTRMQKAPCLQGGNVKQ